MKAEVLKRVNRETYNTPIIANHLLSTIKSSFIFTCGILCVGRMAGWHSEKWCTRRQWQLKISIMATCPEARGNVFDSRACIMGCLVTSTGTLFSNQKQKLDKFKNNKVGFGVKFGIIFFLKSGYMFVYVSACMLLGGCC